MYRLYYWFRGAQEDRPDGPWWSRSFSTWDERQKHFDALSPFLQSWCFTDGREPLTDPVRPPASAEVRTA